MDTATYSRGRGLKINGAARGGHKNKQWIAGQGTVSSQSRESSGLGSDSERWERGGGPRRARGRGRGLARGSPHLTLTVQQEATSGTEDEGQDATDVEGDDDEDMNTDVEEKDPETPEEREKFYQELVKARELERKNAIAEGKMDDPNVPKRLEDAITMVGTCLDMCPRFERYRRERENNLDRWEVIPGTKRVDHKRAVKIYERAAGDKTLPSDLRPPEVLKKTLTYLFHDLVERGGFSDTYNFIRDRSRAVRNDFTIQHETGPLAIECHDRCARFHILAMHLERDSTGFSLAMEEQQLMYTLQSLKEFYEDQRGRYSAPTELEMRVYHRLIHIRDQRERHEEVPQEILSHPVFQLTTKFRLHVQAKSAPITKTSRLLVDAEGMQIFGALAEHLRTQNNVVMIYLVACIIERLFGKGTVDGIEAIRGDLTIGEIIDGVSKPSKAPVAEPIPPISNSTSAEIKRPSNLSSSVPAAPPSVFGPSFSSPSVSSSPQPVQSAFSNLAAKPNPFGNTSSVFGGPTFGSSPSAFSIPKSAFGSAAPAPPSSSMPQPFMPSIPQVPPAAVPAPSFVSAAPSFTISEPLKPPLAINTRPSIFPQAAPPAFSDKPFGSATPGGPTLQSVTNVSSADNVQTSSLNPNAPSFTPVPVLSTEKVPPTPPVNIPSPPKTAVSSLAFVANVPSGPPHEVVAAISSTPPSQLEPISTPKRIVERSETLWEFPGFSPRQLDSKPSGPTTPTTASPMNPPQLGKVEPVALPPTPTTRWFDPTSFPKKGDILSLRKQSLLSLQMPDTPVQAEILSPLALPSPKVAKTTSPQDISPTPKPPAPTLAQRSPSKPMLFQSVEDANSYFPAVLPSHIPNSDAVLSSPQPIASTSRVLAVPTIRSPASSALRKGKEKEVIVDRETLNSMAKDFARRSTTVSKCFKRWKKKTIDRGLSEEAYIRSEAYKERIQQQRALKPQRPLATQSPESPKSVQDNHVARRKRPPRTSNEYRLPVSDDALARQLKETHEEHEKRWTRGSFLNIVRLRAVTEAPDHTYPPQWRIWLSTNSESDATAIWLERKLDVPDSGEWQSSKVFSIPLVPKKRNPPSPGSAGLIIFERTPLDGSMDDIEKKYRILDDCSRLRDVMDTLRSQPKRRFAPALITITWSDESQDDAALDFSEMVKTLLSEKMICGASNFTISLKDKDLDQKFEDALSLLSLDLEDKATVTILWQNLTQLFITPVRTYASDWLDSCWVNDRETLDWARYGEVVRSVEEVQTALVRELLGLLNVPYHVHVPISVDLHDHAHFGEAYATDLFLNSIMETSIRRVEETLGQKLRSTYVLPKERLEATKQRLETVLENVAERLRVHAAAWLSARSSQKRPASDEDSGPGSPSSPKRLKASPTPTVSDRSGGEEEMQTSQFHTPPPPSTTASSIAVTEVVQKPPVTAAMLRALAQGILRGSSR